MTVVEFRDAKRGTFWSMFIWLREQDLWETTNYEGWDDVSGKRVSKFSFPKRSDAVLFKLTWGGK